MLKLIIAGACGRMGRRIMELAAAADDLQIAAAFDLPANAGTTLHVGHESGREIAVAIGGDPREAIAQGGVLIDFTHASGCIENVRCAAALGKASVVGTTGLDAGQRAALVEAAAHVPIVFAPNMSVGVNLLFKLVAEAAAALGLDYNCEITEIHHNQKKDAPSGTAVRLGEIVAHAFDLDYAAQTRHGREGMPGPRPRAEIGMHALRGGDVVGEHTVAFIGQGERIELTHKAHNRDNFARGALVAARFAAKAAPGLYDMQDVLGLR